MFKKVGIIIGVLIILVALGLHWIFKDRPSDNADTKHQIEQTQTGVYQIKESQKETVSNPGNNQLNQIDKTNTNSESYLSPTTQFVQPNQPSVSLSTSSGSFAEVDISQLGNPVRTDSEIVVISKKRVILLDANPNSVEGKQLAYSLELITSNNKHLNHFVPATTFNAFNVGDRLKLTYNIYRNKNGVEFTTIISVELAN